MPLLKYMGEEEAGIGDMCQLHGHHSAESGGGGESLGQMEDLDLRSKYWELFFLL